MTAFPSRGQQAPDYWDTQLKAYIDEADATKADATATTSALAGKADAASTASALAGKADAAATTAALAANSAATATKADDSAVVHKTGAETVAGVKTFSSAPVVPDGSFAEAKVTNLVTDLAGKEPARTTVSQAEAEAGTATTVRGWTAERVKQAVAAYIAGNVAAIRTTLGIAPVPYMWSSTGNATIAATGSHRVGVAQTLAQMRMRVGTAPSGSSLVAVLQRSTNGGSSWSDLVTATITSGSTTENTQTVTTSLSVGDLLRLNVTSVGSTTPATGVVVEVYPA